MILQVGVEHHLMDEARGVLHACSICGGIWTVEGQVEVEVLEILLQTEEVIRKRGNELLPEYERNDRNGYVCKARLKKIKNF